MLAAGGLIEVRRIRSVEKNASLRNPGGTRQSADVRGPSNVLEQP